ncbi:MetQ/NlpA family ABC transporter substrate-binding protein [Actinocorallia longicatena]|uniref:Lipoprotein n=1 Tax=Actinocorallia longicatena TaxID=111803 RepID=A0ABP6QJ78_9ACTN
MLKKITLVLSAAALALTAACGSDSSSDKPADPSKALVVGATATPQGDILNYIKSDLADKAGLKLEVKEFTDYTQLNPAVEDGQIDANYFQHKPYLTEYSAQHGDKLAWTVDVHVEPLGVYSKKVTALTDLKDGATVTIPNDPTNGARALKLLADNGLITLKDPASTTATERDVTANAKHLKFKALDAAQLPRSLEDADAAVINGNYALAAKLTPAKDAIVLEKAEGNPYANGLVVKKGSESDPRVEKLDTLLHSPEVKKFITDKYQGSVLSAF